MKVSLIIHNINRAGPLARCLKSVQAQSWRPLEVVIQDAGSTDGSPELVSRFAAEGPAAGIEVQPWLDCPLRGVAESRNMAAGRATGELLFYMDNDATLPDPEAVAGAVRRFLDDPSLAVATCRILWHDADHCDPSCWNFRRPEGVWREREFESFTFNGGASCVRAAAFRAAGGYWNALRYSREEEDLALALLDGNWRIRYCPELVVRHYPDAGGRRSPVQRRRIELQNGLLVFWRRLPLPAALLLGGLRVATMTWRCWRRREGRLTELWRGVPDAVKLWRQWHPDRRPVAWHTLRRFLLLQLGRTPRVACEPASA